MSDFSYQEILKNWDNNAENSKAHFMNALYEYYGKTDGLFTGLYQRFQKELVEAVRDEVTLEANGTARVATAGDIKKVFSVLASL